MLTEFYNHKFYNHKESESWLVMNAKSEGRIGGIDYGTVRIGIAITDPARTLASPLTQYNVSDPAANARYFKRLVAEEAIALFVVGLPIHLSGEESQKSYEARQFAAWLHESTGVAVELFDERFTTAAAEEFLLAGELTSKQRKSAAICWPLRLCCLRTWKLTADARCRMIRLRTK